MIICARQGCEVSFSPATHNQKFHNAECCRIETNRRIMEKYYAKRDQRQGKARYCKECNITKLSRYNDSDTCGACQTAKQTVVHQSVEAMLVAISWQA